MGWQVSEAKMLDGLHTREREGHYAASSMSRKAKYTRRRESNASNGLSLRAGSWQPRGADHAPMMPSGMSPTTQGNNRTVLVCAL